MGLPTMYVPVYHALILAAFFTDLAPTDIRKCIVIGAGILAFVLIFFGISALGFTASGIKAGT